MKVKKDSFGREKKNVIFQRLLSTSAHPGYRGPPTPYVSQYFHGFRNERVIIDLERTLSLTRIARNAIGSIIRGKGHLLLVNTNPFLNHIIERTAKKTNQSYVNSKWIGGFLTNWKHMKHQKRFKDFSAQQGSPRFLKMQKDFQGLVTRQIPDRSIVLNARKDSVAIIEADRLEIPIVSLVDSTPPKELQELITYPIPVNNDSIQFADLFCELVTKTVIYSKKVRKLPQKARVLAERVEAEHTIVAGCRPFKARKKFLAFNLI
uniref:Ribosomal protein S2 n=1 Tax=Ophioglossum californicum TaxID=1267209 RepID=A0A1B3TRH7_9MONI|nr:ribosomal protein S2 [Ophioglossum californicum]YP_010439859.1 ribosomal protein S2 [Ophioglossum vulgatum]AOH05911.1 ribosomal protein S2 [Ophioglossum californicum]UTD44905.1 ribosomal protein S2 [Ophioglossum vulgatum]